MPWFRVAVARGVPRPTLLGIARRAAGQRAERHVEGGKIDMRIACSSSMALCINSLLRHFELQLTHYYSEN